MLEAIEALGRRTPVTTAPDVFATDVKDGQGLGKAKQTAAEKSSLRVTYTYGEKNYAAGVVEKTTPKAQNLDDRLDHRDVELVNGVDFGRQNGLPEPNA